MTGHHGRMTKSQCVFTLSKCLISMHVWHSAWRLSSLYLHWKWKLWNILAHTAILKSCIKCRALEIAPLHEYRRVRARFLICVKCWSGSFIWAKMWVREPWHTGQTKSSKNLARSTFFTDSLGSREASVVISITRVQLHTSDNSRVSQSAAKMGNLQSTLCYGSSASFRIIPSHSGTELTQEYTDTPGPTGMLMFLVRCVY
jgi:hypothetical protein